MGDLYDKFYTNLAGERIVASWLEKKGFSISRWNTELPGKSEIETNSSNHLIVRVITFIHTEETPELSDEEESRIKTRATQIGAEAWEAKVQLDTKLNQIGRIRWRKIHPVRESKQS